MGLGSWLIDKERRFAWGLFGALIGIVSLILAYLTAKEKRPEITFAVIGEADVLDLHTPLADLAIHYRGQDVQENSLNLRIMTVRVQNTGSVDILQAQYDQAEQWGLLVEHGRVMEARLVGSNSDYLLRRLQPRVVGDSIVFNKVIMEQGRSATLEILVLHDKSVEPKQRPFGKVAGVEQFVTADLRQAAVEQSTWQRVSSGPLSVQILRALLYTAALVFTLLLLALAAAGLTSTASGIASRRRRRAVASFLRQSSSHRKAREVFAKLYVKEGIRGLRSADELLRSPKRLNAMMKSLRRIERDRQGALYRDLPSPEREVMRDYRIRRREFPLEMLPPIATARFLKDQQLIALGEDRPVIINRAAEALDELFLFLGVQPSRSTETEQVAKQPA